MAVPGSGELSLGKIRQELQTNNYAAGPYTAAATSLDDAENGTIATINTCSAVYPLSANPANMSEWYAYDHDAGCPCFGNSFSLDLASNPISALTGSGDFGRDVGYEELVVNKAMSFNWWVKNTTTPLGTNSSQITYFAMGGEAIYDGAGGGYGIVQIKAIIGADPNSFTNLLGFDLLGGQPSSAFYSVAAVTILGSGSNAAETGVSSNAEWDTSNTGTTNVNGFTMLTVVYDPSLTGGGDLVKIYWNSRRLHMPYNSSPGSFYAESYIIEQNGPPLGMEWGDSACLTIGSNVLGCTGSNAETNMHQLIDEFSIWTSTALDQSDIDALYAGLDYQAVPGGKKTLCTSEMNSTLNAGIPTLHYAFETSSVLGHAYVTPYHLGKYGTPVQSSDNA